MRRSAVLLAVSSLALAVSPLASQVAAAAPRATDATTLSVATLPYDFNGDGFAEIVVGVPSEDIGIGSAKITNAGVIEVIPGSATGPDYAHSVEWQQDTPGVAGKSETNDFWGEAMTSGDYNGDGYADLVVDASNESIGSEHDHGMITVLWGSASGLTATGSAAQSFDADAGAQAYVGASLATGDFDNNGKDDLVVGASGENAVFLVYGTPAGLSLTGYQILGVDDVSHSMAEFGFYVAAGDVNGDGYDDIAVGDPYNYSVHGYSTGGVDVFQGSDAGIDNADNTFWTMDTPGIVGVAHSWTGTGDDRLCDCFGFQVALGDVTGDGYADLVVTQPGTPVVRNGVAKQDAGELHMIPGSAAGLTATGDMQINEETPGIPGLAATGDRIGNTLTVSDMDGDGDADVAVALGSEEAVMIMPGGATFGTTGTTWNQNTVGVPGGKEVGDEFGAWLRFTSVKGIGAPQQLLVGAPGENEVGWAWLFDATDEGLSAVGVTDFSQDTTGIPGNAEVGDQFGTF